jgi:Ca-activated chloride channel homolog
MFLLSNPYALLLLPIPLLIRYLLPAATPLNQPALRLPYYQTLKKIITQTTPSASKTILSHWRLASIWCLLCVAMSAPQWHGAPFILNRHAHNIFLALDISGSMEIPDMQYKQQPTDRLTLVKHLATDFIRTRPNDRLGLILFGTHAYLQTPLTFDHHTLTYMLNDASIGLAGPQTALGDAIGLASKHFPSNTKDNILILLTDGANNAGILEPLQATDLAVKKHIQVFTIGLGATQLDVPSLFGSQRINPSQALDTTTLKTIAKLSNGQFFRAQNADDLKRVYRAIDALVPVKNPGGVYRPIKELYPYPLALAILLSLLIALHPQKISWQSKFREKL